MVSSSLGALALVLTLSLVQGAAASAASLLATLTDGASENVVSASSILSTIEEQMGPKRRQAMERRAAPLESALRSTYVALPKNSHGNLGPAAAKYALHRYFVDEKGWFVKGLQDLSPQGNASSSSSPVEILQDEVPAGVKEAFQARLSDRGLALIELAMLAAALEDLVHRDTLSRAAAAFKAERLPLVGRVHVDRVAAVLEHVMMSYILDAAALEPEQRQTILTGEVPMERLYPGWTQTKKFLHDVQEVVAPARRGSLSFEDLTQIIEEVNEHYGRWQDGECQALKTDLLKLEGQCPGRVDLRSFYKSALYDGMWQFSESANYLRSLDTLDESNPKHPRIIAANYILGPSNCLSSSKFYAQCCLDPCDGMMAKLEKALAVPEAEPSAVEAAVTAALPKPEASSPETLRARLHEIARANGGMVPLHGRLFAQWLHHAFPRECPVPPAPGAAQHQEMPEAFTARTGGKYYATEETMMQYYASTEDEPLEQCELPWTPGEAPLVPASEQMQTAVDWPSLPAAGQAKNAAAVVAAAALLSLLSCGAFVVRRKAWGQAQGPLLGADAAPERCTAEA